MAESWLYASVQGWEAEERARVLAGVCTRLFVLGEKSETYNGME